MFHQLVSSLLFTNGLTPGLSVVDPYPQILNLLRMFGRLPSQEEPFWYVRLPRVI